jgi:dolichol-phosphate mannosyltransferase
MRLNTWVVVPTYNEVENIGRLVRAICALDLGLAVLVVDDDSPDGTAALVEEMAARERLDARVLCREGERGLGTAYLAGFRLALRRGADAVVTMDCDFSHDPRAIPQLLAALRTAELVIGSRYVPGGRIENWPVRRKVLSATANRFVQTLFGLPAHDCTSGFRIYRREVLEAVPWHRVRCSGYAFLAETLYWASRQEFVRVREVPICFRDREHGQSKLGLREAVNGARHLLRLRSELARMGTQVPDPLPAPVQEVMSGRGIER